MEKENRYYTPNLEEFHVGFEYEVYDYVWSYSVQLFKRDQYVVVSEPTPGKKWIKHTYERNQFIDPDGEYKIIDYLPDYLEDEKIRVKYLDQQDIEELGWGDYEPPYEYNHKWKLNAWELNAWFNFEMPIVRIEKYHIVCFHGIVKNKSELKKLMKQLEIL